MGARSSVACIRSHPLSATQVAPGLIFQRRVNVWAQNRDINSDILCILCEAPCVHVLFPSNSCKLQGKKDEAEEKAPICLNLHGSPRNLLGLRAFVSDPAGNGLHVHSSPLYDSFSFLFKNSCCDMKLLISKNTINLFLRVARWWKVSALNSELKRRITKLKVKLVVKRVICSFEGKWIVKRGERLSLYLHTASKHFCPLIILYYIMIASFVLAKWFFFLLNECWRQKEKQLTTISESII